MMKSIQMPRPGALGDALEDLVRKADICAKVLAEARKHSQAGRHGALQSQLVARASELLDDMDEILAVLEPASNGPSFGLAATLHRELEQVQVTITNLRDRGAFLRKAADKL